MADAIAFATTDQPAEAEVEEIAHYLGSNDRRAVRQIKSILHSTRRDRTL